MRLLLAALLLSGAFAQEDPRRELARSEREQRDVLRELEDLDQQLIAVEGEIEELQERADQIEAQLLQNEDELLRAQAELDQRSEQVADLLQVVYHINRRGFARIVFSAEDPADLRRRTRYLLSILRETDRVVAGYRDQVELKEAALERVDADRVAIESLQAELRIKESALRDDRARRVAVLEQLQSEQVLLRQALARRGESARSMTTTRGESPTPTVAFRSLRGQLRRPVSGRVLRNYGPYTDPASGTEQNNLGVDIAAARHTPVRVVADGVVISQRYMAGYGLVVVVDHGGDWATVYAHLGRASYREGQKVRRNDVVGTVGETGVTDTLGPRLHFEVRYHNTPQNPADWLAP